MTNVVHKAIRVTKTPPPPPAPIEKTITPLQFCKKELDKCQKLLSELQKEVDRLEVKKETPLDTEKLLTSEEYRAEVALMMHNGHRGKTAKYLGISTRTLYRIILKNNL